MPDVKLLECHESGKHLESSGYQTKLQRYSANSGEMGNNSSKLKLRTELCDKQKTSYLQRNVTETLNFLHFLKSKGIKHSVINAATCILSAFIKLEGFDAGKHPLICRYMKGIRNIAPSLPKYIALSGMQGKKSGI